jgi:hypothetical protein
MARVDGDFLRLRAEPGSLGVHGWPHTTSLVSETCDFTWFSLGLVF